jgi:hypothetical protein
MTNNNFVRPNIVLDFIFSVVAMKNTVVRNVTTV